MLTLCEDWRRWLFVGGVGYVIMQANGCLGDRIMSKPVERDEREQPMCIAVVICSDIIEDRRTGNKTLVNLFNGIGVSQVPIFHSRMFLMASLTNAIGRFKLTFRIKDPSDRELARFDGDAVFPDPLSVVDIVVELQGLQIIQEGIHFVDVLSGDHPLGHRRFNVYPMAPRTNVEGGQ
jgi:hypothetical protein